MSHGQNVTVDVTIGSKCHCGRSELGRNVQAANFLCPLNNPLSTDPLVNGSTHIFRLKNVILTEEYLF